MNRRLPAWAIHILHLAVLAALACWVWRDSRTDGTGFLYPALSVSLPIAQQQSASYSNMLSKEIQRTVEVYPSSWGTELLRRLLLLQKQCDSVLIQLNNRSTFNTALDRNLDNLLDSMKIYTDTLSELTAPFEDRLLRSKEHAPEVSRKNQRAILFEAIKNNVLRAKHDALLYLYRKAASEACWGNYYAPFLQSSVICPRAGEPFTNTVFLSERYPSIYLHPRYDKVWINRQPATIRDGLVEYAATFPKPGAQPLHIRIEKRDVLSDSLRVYEKTYTINVQ